MVAASRGNGLLLCNGDSSQDRENWRLLIKIFTFLHNNDLKQKSKWIKDQSRRSVCWPDLNPIFCLVQYHITGFVVTGNYTPLRTHLWVLYFISANRASEILHSGPLTDCCCRHLILILGSFGSLLHIDSCSHRSRNNIQYLGNLVSFKCEQLERKNEKEKVREIARENYIVREWRGSVMEMQPP